MLHNSNKKIYSKVKSGDWLCLMGTDDYEASRFGYGQKIWFCFQCVFNCLVLLTFFGCKRQVLLVRVRSFILLTLKLIYIWL